jgi:hypothetical protein
MVLQKSWNWRTSSRKLLHAAPGMPRTDKTNVRANAADELYQKVFFVFIDLSPSLR